MRSVHGPVRNRTNSTTLVLTYCLWFSNPVQNEYGTAYYILVGVGVDSGRLFFRISGMDIPIFAPLPFLSIDQGVQIVCGIFNNKELIVKKIYLVVLRYCRLVSQHFYSMHIFVESSTKYMNPAKMCVNEMLRYHVVSHDRLQDCQKITP